MKENIKIIIIFLFRKRLKRKTKLDCSDRKGLTVNLIALHEKYAKGGREES